MQTPIQTSAVDDRGGSIVPVPDCLRELLAPWADAQCTSYDFGMIVRQVLSTPDYEIHAAIFNFMRPLTLYPWRDTSAIALQYIKQGKIIYRLSGSEEVILDASKYNLLHIAAGRHTAQPQEGISESLRIEFAPAYLQELLGAHPQLQKMPDMLQNRHKTAELLPPARMNGKVKNILHEIFQCRKTGPSLYLEMKAHIYSLLSAYDEELTLTSDLEHVQTSKTEKIIMAVKQYVSSYPHIHECSLENLSRQFNISPSALKTNFKKHCHVSLGEFVQQQCLLRAQELLLLGIDPVRDISLQLGYTDVSNFSRAFRNYTGCSPNEIKLHPDRLKNRHKRMGR